MKYNILEKLFVGLMLLLLFSCHEKKEELKFVTINGTDLIAPSGEKFLIRGTNLSNWLNPEGYMFGFKNTSSPRFINEMLCQLAGPAFVRNFWKEYKDNYITRDDIRFIKSTGANTVRLPFHYKLFTNEDYLGLTVDQDGFARIDSVVNWCRDEKLFLIIDMHDAPGGQTGDNIDDSYGYPWLFECKESQDLYCSIWSDIAKRYANEPVVLGYELLNEPIAHYFENKQELNSKLLPVYKKGVSAIREFDKNHIILLGGAQWNSVFTPLDDWTFDDKIMFTCHRYGGAPTKEAIQSFIDFRDKTGLPMYMGEIGHNTNEWMAQFVATMEENNIGWTFWPYKKMDRSETDVTSFTSILKPENWDTIIEFAETPRNSYKQIREAYPSSVKVKNILSEYLNLCKFKNNVVNEEYIKALGLETADR